MCRRLKLITPLRIETFSKPNHDLYSLHGGFDSGGQRMQKSKTYDNHAACMKT